MNVFVIANPKGGAGKSTLATNLAGYLASREELVMLGDIDRQQSCRDWLSLRPESAAPIFSWEIGHDAIARPPRGTTHAVLDTPAGLHGKMLAKVLKLSPRIIIPVQPSLFDILATRKFIASLLEERDVQKGKVDIAVVGMRVDARTRAARELDRFFSTLDGRESAQAEPEDDTALPLDEFDRFFTTHTVPVLTYLRDTQTYVQAAAAGLTIFDLPPSRAATDVEQWQPLIDWINATS
jgi:chromosome partitioning protein